MSYQTELDNIGTLVRARLVALERVAKAAAAIRGADIIVHRSDWPLSQELDAALDALTAAPGAPEAGRE